MKVVRYKKEIIRETDTRTKTKKLVHALGEMLCDLTKEYMDKYSNEFIYEHSDPDTLRRKFSARAVVIYADDFDPNKLLQENEVKRIITVDENGNEETFRG